MNPGVHSGSESFSMPLCKEVRSDNIATGPGVSSFDEGGDLDTQIHSALFETCSPFADSHRTGNLQLM